MLQKSGRLVLWEAMFILELHSAETQVLFLEFPYFYPHFSAFTGSAINNFQKMPKI